MGKRRFAVVTDSASDMPRSYYEEREVEVVPLGFTVNRVDYEGENGIKIAEKDFYALLRAGGMPTTYQVTAENAKPHIEKYLERGKDVLIVAFSSALSGTAGSFKVAARELVKKYPKRKLIVVDSLCASMGEGLLLHYVLQRADEGASIEETARYAESLKREICHQFTVDTLFHLKRGGRVSTATAILGSVLKIKPILHVNDEGKLVVAGKVMGRKKSLGALVDRVVDRANMGENDPIFIGHGDCAEDVEQVKKLLKEKFPDKQIYVHYVGVVIGAHAGAGTVAIFYRGRRG